MAEWPVYKPSSLERQRNSAFPLRDTSHSQLLSAFRWHTHSSLVKPSPALAQQKIKECQVRTKEKGKRRGTLSTLRIILENKEASDGKEEVISQSTTV